MPKQQCCGHSVIRAGRCGDLIRVSARQLVAALQPTTRLILLQVPGLLKPRTTVKVFSSKNAKSHKSSLS